MLLAGMARPSTGCNHAGGGATAAPGSPGAPPADVARRPATKFLMVSLCPPPPPTQYSNLQTSPVRIAWTSGLPASNVLETACSPCLSGWPYVPNRFSVTTASWPRNSTARTRPFVFPQPWSCHLHATSKTHSPPAQASVPSSCHSSVLLVSTLEGTRNSVGGFSKSSSASRRTFSARRKASMSSSPAPCKRKAWKTAVLAAAARTASPLALAPLRSN
mmetsp:Transcript_156474/g.480014  ORF Transcript_156474/g.480014 Transcript_156474/m.480014 type:complete len:218 (-) Transcript_156474:636-1289(-)